MGIDLSTKAGVLRFAELRRNEMARQYVAKGSLDENPLLYVFATHAVSPTGSNTEPFLRTGQRFPSVQVTPCPFPKALIDEVEWRDRTRVLGHAVRDFAKASKAVGVLTLMEAWMASEEKAPQDHHYGWVEENAEGEGLFMSLEHLALPSAMIWISRIHRDPLRLDPWSTGPSMFSEKGRLTNFVDWRS